MSPPGPDVHGPDVHGPDVHGPILLAGATGDLGGRIAAALSRRGVAVRALVRPGRPTAARAALQASGATLVEAAHDDAPALRAACAGAQAIPRREKPGLAAGCE